MLTRKAFMETTTWWEVYFRTLNSSQLYWKRVQSLPCLVTQSPVLEINLKPPTEESESCFLTPRNFLACRPWLLWFSISRTGTHTLTGTLWRNLCYLACGILHVTICHHSPCWVWKKYSSLGYVLLLALFTGMGRGGTGTGSFDRIHHGTVSSSWPYGLPKGGIPDPAPPGGYLQQPNWATG